MPELTIPLVGQPTQRGLITRGAFSAGQDQRFINCLFTSIKDGEKGTKNVYVEKRQGIEAYSTPSSGNVGLKVFVSPATNKVISIFNTGSSILIYAETTNCGTLDSSSISQINEALLGGTVSYVIFTTSLGTGWFLASDSFADTSFTGDTHTNTTIDNIAGAGGLYVGQLISGTGIQADTRIASRTPDTTTPTSITTTLATTASASITITKEPVAKIISANFPSAASGLVEMDGFIFTADITNAIIAHSDINSIVNWSAISRIPANISSDSLGFSAKYRNRILGFGSNTIQPFYNAGNPSGSVLSADKDGTQQIGGTFVSQVNEYLFFIGPPTLNPGVWMMSRDGVRKISTPIIDRDLSTSFVFSTNISSIFYAGYTWLILFTSAGTIFFYCVELDSWNEQLFSTTVVDANSLRRVSNLAGPFFISGSTNGKVYTWDGSPTYQDDGASYTMTIQTEPKVLNKGKGFIINSVELLADNQSSGSTQLEISRDDYASFQVLGSFDLTQRRKRIVRGGLCRNHAIFRLTDSGNNAWRAQAIVVNYSPCAT